MDEINRPQNNRSRGYGAWGRFALLTLALLAIIFLLSGQRGGSNAAVSRAMARVMSGDYYLKFAYLFERMQTGVVGGVIAANNAEQFRERALVEYNAAAKEPVPSGIRKYAILRESMGRGNALEVLERLDDKAVLDTLDSDRRASDLRSELQMWRRIYADSPQLSERDVEDYRARIEKIRLGPVKPIALSHLYRTAGRTEQAESVIEEARRKYTGYMAGMLGLLVLVGLTAVAGIGVLAYFGANRQKIFLKADEEAARCRSIHYPVLWLSFLGYMIAFVVIGIFTGVITGLVIGDRPPDESILYILGAQLAASVLSGMIGLSVLVYFTKVTGGDLCDIGLTVRDFWKNVGWGFAGYAALLPILFVLAAASSALFGGAGSMDHPIVPMILAGGWLSKAAILILASVLAPFFEEIFFRGVLYNALKARLSMVWAVAASAFLFAIIHPQLPAGFLPIFGIGVVLAVLFESRRSLVPCMVAHALNNTVMLLFTILAFAN